MGEPTRLGAGSSSSNSTTPGIVAEGEQGKKAGGLPGHSASRQRSGGIVLGVPLPQTPNSAACEGLGSRTVSQVSKKGRLARLVTWIYQKYIVWQSKKLLEKGEASLERVLKIESQRELSSDNQIAFRKELITYWLSSESEEKRGLGTELIQNTIEIRPESGLEIVKELCLTNPKSGALILPHLSESQKKSLVDEIDLACRDKEGGVIKALRDMIGKDPAFKTIAVPLLEKAGSSPLQKELERVLVKAEKKGIDEFDKGVLQAAFSSRFFSREDKMRYLKDIQDAVADKTIKSNIIEAIVDGISVEDAVDFSITLLKEYSEDKKIKDDVFLRDDHVSVLLNAVLQRKLWKEENPNLQSELIKIIPDDPLIINYKITDQEQLTTCCQRIIDHCVLITKDMKQDIKDYYSKFYSVIKARDNSKANDRIIGFFVLRSLNQMLILAAKDKLKNCIPVSKLIQRFADNLDSTKAKKSEKVDYAPMDAFLNSEQTVARRFEIIANLSGQELAKVRSVT